MKSYYASDCRTEHVFTHALEKAQTPLDRDIFLKAAIKPKRSIYDYGLRTVIRCAWYEKRL